MSAIPLSQLASSGCWQHDFLNVMPAVQKHAAICFRSLRAERRAEATAEAIAQALVAYEGLVRKNQLSRAYASSLANYAVKVVKDCRRVGGHKSSCDIMSPLTQKRRGFVVGSLGAWGPPDGPWQEVVVESRRAGVAGNPATLAAFRLDFAQWLSQWSQRDRRIINALAAGNRTQDVAQRFKVSAARISQLRRAYQRSWETFQGMTPVSLAA